MFCKYMVLSLSLVKRSVRIVVRMLATPCSAPPALCITENRLWPYVTPVDGVAAPKPAVTVGLRVRCCGGATWASIGFCSVSDTLSGI